MKSLEMNKKSVVAKTCCTSRREMSCVLRWNEREAQDGWTVVGVVVLCRFARRGEEGFVGLRSFVSQRLYCVVAATRNVNDNTTSDQRGYEFGICQSSRHPSAQNASTDRITHSASRQSLRAIKLGLSRSAAITIYR